MILLNENEKLVGTIVFPNRSIVIIESWEPKATRDRLRDFFGGRVVGLECTLYRNSWLCIRCYEEICTDHDMECFILWSGTYKEKMKKIPEFVPYK